MHVGRLPETGFPQCITEEEEAVWDVTRFGQALSSSRTFWDLPDATLSMLELTDGVTS